MQSLAPQGTEGGDAMGTYETIGGTPASPPEEREFVHPHCRACGRFLPLDGKLCEDVIDLPSEGRRVLGIAYAHVCNCGAITMLDR